YREEDSPHAAERKNQAGLSCARRLANGGTVVAVFLTQESSTMSHTLRMLLGCLLPLALIFVLPLLGVDQGISLFIFLILMFACHLLMLGGHHGHHQHSTRPRLSKGKKYE
ncbi:MAG: hypothetical protein AB7G75_24400, partial [Candidatus Binatia bacterium]